jgi:hypothetical protein
MEQSIDYCLSDISNQLPYLTEQEIKITDFLILKGEAIVYWEELAQFAKDPQNVKLKTIKRAVSEIKRINTKYCF